MSAYPKRVMPSFSVTVFLVALPVPTYNIDRSDTAGTGLFMATENGWEIY